MEAERQVQRQSIDLPASQPIYPGDELGERLCIFQLVHQSYSGVPFSSSTAVSYLLPPEASPSSIGDLVWFAVPLSAPRAVLLLRPIHTRGTILILPTLKATCCGVIYFRRSASADFSRVEEISSGIASERDSGHSYTLHYP